ncbi:hypothetical protein Vadar_014224 [Vaccinium darrowii]|uniref:Uncharacterized protein n=1 Tax=Vaccinium darrowii TaxID=229202 RepID=A0ACB7YM47_9ERIC|nr:hypothetical protein Vadar_014224 [Vaccinium darrowii]
MDTVYWFLAFRNILLYPVTSSFGTPVFFSLERAAALYFGTKPHGVACGDNIVKECEEEAGIPSSISIDPLSFLLVWVEHLCPPSAEARSAAVHHFRPPISDDGWRHEFQSQTTSVDSLAIYPFEFSEYMKVILSSTRKTAVPSHLILRNTSIFLATTCSSSVLWDKDGEVESFKLTPIVDVANVIKKTEYFKPNCNLVIMDFLFRHGFIRPEQFGYLKLLQSLRSGDCS